MVAGGGGMRKRGRWVTVELPMRPGYGGTLMVVDFHHLGLERCLWARVREMGWEMVEEVTKFNIAMAKVEMQEGRN